ncbi:MAG: SurA N-terminal domain-containing protein [Sphingomonas sp.]|uniref:peptidylprolyl isomerase n=1 Tax=Sphingomonas sp. TaxID=28214 RepID=UPI001AC6D64E|nr:peptidylprolyl isomerase [Sphingomonas sp.]MBN8815073.1 SurA N-terminal domain-containing protein [Sphingomonas sp.]
MLGIFRGFLNSKVGLIITFAVLGIIALAFGLGDVTGLRSNAVNGGPTGSTLVTIGKEAVTSTEIRANTERTINAYRQQYPQLTMEEFITKGGFDGPFENRINSTALALFGESQGMRVGRALADTEITSQPQFKGLDGKFDRELYKQFLAQQRMGDAELHTEIGRNMLAQLVIGPMLPQATGTLAAPASIATPYASMLLEKRTGTVAFIDTKKIPQGAPVTDAEAAAYYKANIDRYTVPERRSVRYATVSIADLRAKSAPTDAEIAKAYTAAAATFAPTEKRSMRQVVLLDQKSADALAAKVRSGTPIEAAAKAVGLDAGLLADQTKAAYAAQTSAAIADQLFAANEGAVIGPVKTALGWAVIHLEKITKVPGKTLEQAKPDLVKTLTDQKTAVAASALRAQISDAIANNATIDEIAQKLSLTLQSSPALDAQGNDPDTKTPPPAQPDPLRAVLSAVAFQADVEDNPQIAPVDKEGGFALVKLDKVVPAAPRPLASVIDEVKKNFIVDRQVRAARDVATAVRDKVGKGTPLAKALAETGIAFDATKPITGTRGQLVGTNKPDRGLILLFNTPQGAAKVLEAPYKGGWFVIVTDSIQRGDARQKPDEIKRLQAYLGGQAADEYAQQFVRAVRNQVGVKRNDAAINALRAELLGQGGSPDGQ